MATRVTAYLGGGYILASLIYAGATRFMPRPLADSLTPEQRKVQRTSTVTRLRVFVVALIVSVLLLGLVRPF